MNKATGGQRRGRALLIECCPYHEELFPAWRHVVEDLGYRLDIAAGTGKSQAEVLASLDPQDLRIYRTDRLADIPFDDYDFVLLGTLVHAGYGLHTPVIGEHYGFAPGVPLPDLDLLQRIGRPSIAVVHEPMAWTEHLPTACFELARRADGEEVERGFLRLLPGGRWFCTSRLGDTGPWIERFGDVSSTASHLQLHETASRWDFATHDGGRTYETPDGSAHLRPAAYRRPDLGSHLGSGRHAVVVLSEAGRAYLQPAFPGVECLLPFALMDGPRSEPAATEYVFAAGIDHRRKAMESLLDAVASTGQEVVLVGGAREEDFDANPWVRRFRRQIAERGLHDRFHFTGHLSHPAFLERVREARFLLPLVNDQVDGGAYRTKPPAAILLSLCFGVPMIVDESIARRFEVDGLAVTYAGDDLGSGLAAARVLDDEAYRTLRTAVSTRASEVRASNRATLAMILERILAAAGS